MNSNSDETTLEDLIAKAFRRARSVVGSASRARVGRDAREHAFAQRCLNDLEQDGLLEDRIDGALGALRDILGKEIAAETLGHHRVFDGWHDPDVGDIGRVREIPVRTDHGDELSGVLAELDALVEIRERAKDRLRAEQEVRRKV